MINLLPAEARKGLARERFGRFLFVAGIALFCLSVSGAGLFGLTFFSLNLQKNEFVRELEAAQKNPTLPRVKAVEASISQLNERLRFFSRSLKRENTVTRVLKEVIFVRTPSVVINEISFRGSAEFNVAGNAGTRNDLLEFIRRIEANDVVDEITSPISNLIKDRDIDFTLSYTVRQEVLSEGFLNTP